MPVSVPRFDRHFFDGTERFTCIGDGEVGGKATGLLRIRDVLRTRIAPGEFPNFDVDVPRLTVIATGVYDAFMKRNGLGEVAFSDASDAVIANTFQRADLPAEIVGDLRAIVEKVHQPLAVRSSSRLEDAIFRPFAGVYATKMIPNNQHDADTRFRKLVEAVKFVYASTHFRNAKNYIRATDHAPSDEKMAVIIQEVVGGRHGDRFYPELSGVARSFSFYRSGRARPEDGVVNLALGLGKTIVDGGVVWSYSPAFPKASPPFASASAMLKQTQTEFWAVNMGKPPAYDPIAETEYLVLGSLSDAEEDETLRLLASTYDAASDRLVAGTGPAGARALTFAPMLVLELLPLNRLVRRVLSICEEELGEKVEVEFALVPGRSGALARFGFLQVRPLVVLQGFVDVPEEEMAGEGVLLASRRVLGNGVVSGIHDVVYVRPDRFEASRTRQIAGEIAVMNNALLDAGRPYLLVGFGRWGSSDPWLGIPVNWGQICGAKAIVEATLPTMNVDPSEGSHFFHNISSFGVSYFCVRHDDEFEIAWTRLDTAPAEQETEYVRHVRLAAPLEIRVDGRSGQGVVRGARGREAP
jgi:hypothetical protein